MKNKMPAGIIKGFTGIRVCQNYAYRVPVVRIIVV